MAASDSNQHLRFINETSGGGHRPKALSPVKRQIVRSQAMIAVRRKQRQEAEKYLRLRWTNPKLARKDGNDDEDSPSPARGEDEKKIHPAGKYKFVEEAQSATPGSAGPQGGAGIESISPRQRVVGSRDEEVMRGPVQQADLVGSWHAPPVHDLIERFGGGRRNPFESYPIALSREVNELMDHYTVVIPHLMYGTKFDKPMQRLLYYLSFNDLAALCAIMAHASRHIDSLHGTSDSPRSLRHITATMRAVNDSLRSGDSTYDDATIFAVGQLATTERRFGARSVSKQHWVGLKRILEQSGGLQSISQNRQLEGMLVWNDLVFARDQHSAGVETDDWPTLLDDDPVGPEGKTRHQRLLEFLDQLESTSCKASQREHEPGSMFRLWKQRQRVFSNGSILHNTLFGQPEIEDYQRSLTTRACQNSCLMYFGVALLDYADKPDMEQLLLRVLEDIVQAELSRGLSPEHLIARLIMGLIGEDADTASCRARKVMRLMLEVKELDSETCGLIRERLWRSVSLSCQH